MDVNTCTDAPIMAQGKVNNGVPVDLYGLSKFAVTMPEADNSFGVTSDNTASVVAKDHRLREASTLKITGHAVIPQIQYSQIFKITAHKNVHSIGGPCETVGQSR